jgi:hypothetical protein
MTTTLEKPAVKKPSGKIETRARDYCRHLIETEGGSILVHWKKSSMYGSNPVIRDQTGEICTRISGCGYDKLSACLCEALHWLFPDPVNLGSGAGVRRVQENLLKRGWILEHRQRAGDVDLFTLAPVQPDPAPVDLSEPSNPDRLARADAVVDLYRQLAGLENDSDDALLSDLLADLMHWAHREGHDFAARARLAEMHFEEEQAEG